MILNFFKRRKAFTLIVTSALVVVAVLVSAVRIIQFKDTLVANAVLEVGKQQQYFAKDIATLLEFRISTLQERLMLLAHIPQIQNEDAVVCEKKVKDVFLLMGTAVGNISRVNPSGEYYCSEDESFVGLTADKVGPFLRQILADPQHKPVLGRMFVVPGKEKVAMSLHVPVYSDTGVFAGTLGGTIYIDEFQEKYLKGIAFVRRGYVMVVDDNGDILHHPDPDLVGKTISSPQVQETIDGEEFSEMLEAAKSGKEGIVQLGKKGARQAIAYTSAHVFTDRRWIVLLTIPISDVEGILENSGFYSSMLWIILVIGSTLLFIPAMIFFYLLAPQGKSTKEIDAVLDGAIREEREMFQIEKQVKDLQEKFDRLRRRQ